VKRVEGVKGVEGVEGVEGVKGVEGVEGVEAGEEEWMAEDVEVPEDVDMDDDAGLLGGRGAEEKEKEVKKRKPSQREPTSFSYQPRVHEPVSTRLALSPEALGALRVGYYDGANEKVLPVISQLFSQVMKRAAAAGLPVAPCTSDFAPLVASSTLVGKQQILTRTSEAVSAEVQKFLEPYDVIITPASPVFPPLVGAPPPKREHWLHWNIFYYPFQLAGCPALMLPVSKSPDGMPISIQIVGKPQSDRLVLQVAYFLENTFGTQYPIHLPEGDQVGGGMRSK